MHFRRSLLAAAALATATVPGLAPSLAQETRLAETMRLLQRVATQYTVLMARMFVDLTYDRIAIEPGTNDLIVTGLRLYPELAWDQDGRCEIAVERAVIADANSFDVLRTTIQLAGLTLPSACLEPEIAATLAGLGHDGLVADAVSLDLAYHLPSSAADLALQASVVDAAEIALDAHFDYLFLRFPVAAADPDAADPAADPAAAIEPVPVARLGSAELVIENAGLWQVLEPMMTAQMGDLSVLPQMVQMGVGELFTDGGTRTPTPEEAAFVDNLAAEVARFLADRDRIVITAAPAEGSVLLTEEMMASPGALIAALDPVVSAAPRAYREMVAPADLAAALAGDEALDAEARLRIGRALVTGIGAPRAVEAGQALLAPLAEAWNAPAALLTARAAQSSDPQLAYAMALRAMAGGEAEAAAIADEIEAELPLVAVLAAQDEAARAWPGAGEQQLQAEELITAGDVAGMRRRAYAAATGRGRPRSYGGAYYWATLAAAAGDRGAASLRQRLDDRFAGQEGWPAVAEGSATAALDIWTERLGETIAARIRR